MPTTITSPVRSTTRSTCRRYFEDLLAEQQDNGAGFDYIYQAADGDRAFIVYEGRTSSGQALPKQRGPHVRDGRLVATEVYFGWDVPHKVHPGKHVENGGQEDT